MTPLADLAARWPRLNALLDQVLDVSPAGRAAWIDALDGEPAELKDTLRRLIEGRDGVDTKDFLSTLPRLDATPASAELHEGALIGPYRLVRALGHGGMGAVWLAERSDGQLRRQVALKLPHLTWGGNLAERLARERDILARLEHPNIARLYDAGVDALGRPWMAMEYVQGWAIDVHARERALDVPARLALLLQVCSAVAYAHSRLVIHRDLKPSNILVTDEGQVRLLDFGIAKLLQGEHAEATALTQLAGQALTPNYASPEQVRGEALTTASDVYSLGVVAYELLCEQRPYRLKRGTAAELEEMIAGADPPLASRQAPGPARRKALQGDLDAILAKALQKSASRRYDGVASLAADLSRHLSGEAISARPDSRWQHVGRFVKRHRMPVAASVLAVTGLAAATVVALWQSREALTQARLANRAAEREAAVSTLYIEALTTVSGWEPRRLTEPQAISKALQNKLDELEKRYRGSPERRSALLETVATQLPYMGDVDAALAVSQRLVEHLEREQASADEILTARSQMARTLLNSARYAQGESVMLAAFEQPRAAQASPVARARALNELGAAQMWLGKRGSAQRTLEQAEALLVERPAESKLRSTVLQSLARTQIGFDAPAAATTMLRSHELLRGVAGAGPDQIAASLMFVAAALAEAARPVEAEARLREALGLWRPLFGDTDRDTVSAVGRLAHALAAQLRFDEAHALLETQLAAVRATSLPDTPFMLQTLHTRLRQLALARGDVGAATAGPAPAGVEAARTEPMDKFIADHDLLVASGQAALALTRAERRWSTLTADQRHGPAGVRIQLATAQAQHSLGAHAASAQTAQALMTQLEQDHATASASFTEAVERAAQGLAAAGRAEHAATLLRQDERRPAPTRVPAPTRSGQADAALRRAEVWLAAGDRDAAAAALSAAARDLVGQHPHSPRLAWAARLSSPVRPADTAR
jgi:serine/threonine protein kinase